MQDSLQTALRIAASGLQAQSTRLRIVSQNIANAQSTGSASGADPYTRQTVSFESEMDKTLGANVVAVKSIGVDSAPFKLEHDPGNPAADEGGMVKMPKVAKQSADMLNTTISLMKDA
jgi:flagellar basal-body rod protein FlgC